MSAACSQADDADVATEQVSGAAKISDSRPASASPMQLAHSMTPRIATLRAVFQDTSSDEDEEDIKDSARSSPAQLGSTVLPEHSPTAQEAAGRLQPGPEAHLPLEAPLSPVVRRSQGLGIGGCLQGNAAILQTQHRETEHQTARSASHSSNAEVTAQMQESSRRPATAPPGVASPALNPLPLKQLPAAWLPTDKQHVISILHSTPELPGHAHDQHCAKDGPCPTQAQDLMPESPLPSPSETQPEVPGKHASVHNSPNSSSTRMCATPQTTQRGLEGVPGNECDPAGVPGVAPLGTDVQQISSPADSLINIDLLSEQTEQPAASQHLQQSQQQERRDSAPVPAAEQDGIWLASSSALGADSPVYMRSCSPPLLWLCLWQLHQGNQMSQEEASEALVTRYRLLHHMQVLQSHGQVLCQPEARRTLLALGPGF